MSDPMHYLRGDDVRPAQVGMTWQRCLLKLATVMATCVLLQPRLYAPQVPPQPDGRILALRRNVVKVSYELGGYVKSGFGFIVSERGGKLYIVTAEHLLLGPLSMGHPSISVVFFIDQGKTHKAEILDGKVDHDLGLLEVESPPGFEWERQCLAPAEEEKRGTPVWSIGRDGEWYVPVASGFISSPNPNADSWLEADIPGPMPGTSGSPLVTNTGIVGMVTRRYADHTQVLSIYYIKNSVQDWGYPWDLTTLIQPPSAHDLTQTPGHSDGGRNWYGLLWSRIMEKRGLSISILVALLALVTLSSRLIVILMAQDVWLINKLAPWFYLSRFGQRKLFRTYKRELVGNADVREDAVRYVDLPYEWNGSEDLDKLSNKIGVCLHSGRNLQVIAEGGRGKTALCRYLAVRLVRNELAPQSQRLQPVIVDGLGYSGDLLNAIVNSLKQWRAYVNSTIVESQLSMGNLVVMFDGFSEIREAFRNAADVSDVPAFIKQHPDTPFIFTSRSPLPVVVEQAMRGSVTVKLKDVDADTERAFLAHYLKRGSLEVESVISQMRESLEEMPRIPLMLKLIAAVYDETGRVPADRSTLLSQYGDQLLRAEATGIEDPAGLKFAIRHLVRETYLRSGGDRGFTVDEGVRLLGAVRVDLANYDVKLSPIALVSLLCRAGVLKRTLDYCRFFHDSFESYFGARALLADFQGRQYAMISECKGNERLKESWEFFISMLDTQEEFPRLAAALSIATVKSAPGVPAASGDFIPND